MAKAQGKKAVVAGKSKAKKAVARVKSVASAAKKKVAPKKPAAPAKRAGSKVAAKAAPKKVAAKKPVPKAAKPVAKPAKPAAKPARPAAKPAGKSAAAQVKKAVKTVGTIARKAVAKATAKAKAVPKAVAKVKAAARPVKPAAKPVKAAKPLLKVAEKPAPKPAPKQAPVAEPAVRGKAAKPAVAPKPAAPLAAAPVAAAPAAEPEKKRGRRPRPRIVSNGAPAAAWLTTEKPRPASFIPAPARAEAPSAIAAPPASSDRLLRPDDVEHPAVRTVPVRIDVEQSAGRYYVIANPTEVTVRPGEGIEWDFRYLGGADVSVEEIVIEFAKPSPFPHAVFKTRKPGGARPHRQLSDGALPAAAGKRIEYTVRALNPFKTELANAKIWVNIQ